MLRFKEFYEQIYIILDEEIHKELQSILDEPESATSTRELYDRTSQKLNNFSRKARELIKRGEDTGLEEGRPKKGSSRAVFFPKDDKEINIDGKPAKAKSVVKIAFPGTLDRYMQRGDRLLGEHQNQAESDHYVSQNYGMLREHDDGSYSTNHEGVLAPILGTHPEDHYLEMGHVSPMKKSDFQRLTVSESHPKGLKFDDMKNALEREYYDAHGESGYVPSKHTDEIHEKTLEHPFVQRLSHMIMETGFHPGDISPRNMGIWTHPHTGQQYPVMSDYGFSKDIAREYGRRRMRQRGLM